MSFPPLTPEYADLKPLTGEWDIVYGPVASRRLGSSLGVNLLGKAKICSFDCPYCELGLSQVRMNQLKEPELFPSVAQVADALRNRMRQLIAEGRTPDHITISGNGEPTLHPDFLECVNAVLAARADLSPGTRVVVMSNGAHCDNRRVVQALNRVDERLMKLDAGGDLSYKRVNRPLVRASLAKIAANIRKLNGVIVQSMFVQGKIDNTGLSDLEEWMEMIGIVQPKLVQICTLDRVPAEPGLKKCDEETLYTIASRLKRKLQIDCAVFA